MVKLLYTSNVNGEFNTYLRAASYLENNEYIYFDGGNFFNGSELSKDYFENTHQYKNELVELLNNVNCDLQAISQNEFMNGVDYLKDTVNSATYDFCCANLKTKRFDILPYKTFEVDGVKISILSCLAKFDGCDVIKGVKFVDVLKTYEHYEEELINNSDIIIVNYNGSSRDDVLKLTSSFSSIDILFSPSKIDVDSCEVINPDVTFKYIYELNIDCVLKKISDVVKIDVSKLEVSIELNKIIENIK